MFHCVEKSPSLHYRYFTSVDIATLYTWANSMQASLEIGPPLTAKNLSAAKQMADIIDAKREQQILDCIRILGTKKRP